MYSVQYRSKLRLITVVRDVLTHAHVQVHHFALSLFDATMTRRKKDRIDRIPNPSRTMFVWSNIFSRQTNVAALAVSGQSISLTKTGTSMRGDYHHWVFCFPEIDSTIGD